MGKGGNGGATGAGAPNVRASLPVLALQEKINGCVDLSKDELRSLLAFAVETPNLDLRPFTKLKPRQAAELIDLPEWKILCDSMIALSVLDPEDRLTKTQKWALAFFRKSMSGEGAEKRKVASALANAKTINVITEDDGEPGE